MEARIPVALAEVRRCFVLQREGPESPSNIFACAPRSLEAYLRWVQRYEQSLIALMSEHTFRDGVGQHEGEDVFVVQDVPDADNLISLRYLLTRFIKLGSRCQIHIVGRPANLAIGKAIPISQAELLQYDLSKIGPKVLAVKSLHGPQLVAYSQLQEGKLGVLYDLQADNRTLKEWQERPNDLDSKLVSEDLRAQMIAMISKYSDMQYLNVEYIDVDYPPELILSEALHADSYNFFDDSYNLVFQYQPGQPVPDLARRVKRMFGFSTPMREPGCCQCSLL